MKNKFNLILLAGIILSSIFLTSCSNPVSPRRFTKNYYTVNALLRSGTSISQENPVMICKVPGINLSEVFVPDAIVTIKEYQKNPNLGSTGDTYDVLTNQYNLVVGLSQTDSMFVPCYYDPANNLIKADYKYHIDITIPGYNKTITAETIVPKAAELMPNFNFTPPAGQGFTTDPSDNLTSIPYNEVNGNYPVTVKVAGLKTINFIVELYCREEFSTELEYTSVIMGKKHPTEADRTNYLSSGDTSRRFMIMSKFTPQQHPDGNWYVSWTDFRQAFVFYGRYRVKALMLDDNYYSYRSKPEGYYYGGVTNALGCFGSASGGVMYTKIVK